MSLKRVPLLTIVLCLLVGTILLSRQTAQANPFSHSDQFVIISDNSQFGAFFPLIRTAPDGTLLIVYNHNLTGSGTSTRPYYSLSTDSGKTWSTPTAVYDGPIDSFQINATFDSNSTIHAVWYSTTDANNNSVKESQVLYARQNQWPGTAIQVAAAPEGRNIVDPAIEVASNGTLHAAWLQGNASGVLNVYHAFSTNNGTSWQTSPVTDVDDSNASYSYNMVIDPNGVIHVVWAEDKLSNTPGRIFDYEVLYSKGIWNGNGYTWTSAVALTDVQDAIKPFILVADSRLHVVFELREEETEDDLRDKVYPYYMTASLSGSDWSQPEDISNGSFVYVPTNLPYFLGTSLTVCGGQPAIFYHGSPQANSAEQIWRVRKTTTGWSFPVPITDDPGQRYANPSVTCKGSNVHLSFSEIITIGINHRILYTGDRDIMFLPLVRTRF